MTQSSTATLILISFTMFAAACSQEIGVGSIGTASKQKRARPVYSPTPKPTLPPLAEKVDHELEAEIASIAAEAAGKVGVGAVLLETGDAAWLEKDGKFPSQSVYKVPIAMAVLDEVDKTRLRLGQDAVINTDDFVRQGYHSPIRNLNPGGTVMSVYEIMRYSISESDGSANDVLYDMAGGSAKIQAYLNGLGITDFIVADSTKAISQDWETQYRNWATPRASIELMRALHYRTALSDESTDLLLKFMSESDTGRRRLKRGIPEGATLAHKTGTGGARDGVTSATNDVGIITLPDGRHIAIAVYIADSSADMWQREKVIADIAAAVCEKWAPEFKPDEATKGV